MYCLLSSPFTALSSLLHLLLSNGWKLVLLLLLERHITHSGVLLELLLLDWLPTLRRDVHLVICCDGLSKGAARAASDHATYAVVAKAYIISVMNEEVLHLVHLTVSWAVAVANCTYQLILKGSSCCSGSCVVWVWVTNYWTILLIHNSTLVLLLAVGLIKLRPRSWTWVWDPSPDLMNLTIRYIYLLLLRIWLLTLLRQSLSTTTWRERLIHFLHKSIKQLLPFFTVQ